MTPAERQRRPSSASTPDPAGEHRKKDEPRAESQRSRLRSELTAAAEREASAIVSNARTEIYRILVGAHRQLARRSTQPQTAPPESRAVSPTLGIFNEQPTTSSRG